MLTEREQALVEMARKQKAMNESLVQGLGILLEIVEVAKKSLVPPDFDLTEVRRAMETSAVFNQAVTDVLLYLE